MIPWKKIAGAVAKADGAGGARGIFPAAAAVAEGCGTRCYSTYFRPAVFRCHASGCRLGRAALTNNYHASFQRCSIATGREKSPSNGAVAEELASSNDINIPGAETGGRKLAIIFTCTQCNTRSAKQFSEKAYKQGIVIATCPGCQKKHLIADNLGFFTDDDGGWNVQKAMEQLGQKVKVVTNDDVLELSLEDIFTAEAINAAVNEGAGGAVPEKDDGGASKST